MVKFRALSLTVVLSFVLVASGCAAPAPTATPTTPPKPAGTQVTPKPAATATPTSAPAKKVTIKFAWPLAGAFSKPFNAMAQNIGKYSNGTITMEVFPDGQLYKDFQPLIEGVISGAVEMGATPLNRWASLIPATNAQEVPFNIDGTKHMEKALDAGFGDLFAKELSKKGVTLVDWWHLGVVGTLDNRVRPIKKPEDMRGMKLRVPSPLTTEMIRQYGAEAVTIPAGDVYLGLQQGTFDGVFTASQTVVSLKWYEVAKYSTAAPFTFLSFMVFMNNDAWKNLAPSQQDAIKKAAKEIRTASIQEAEKVDTDSLQEMKRLGMEVYEVPASELPVWREASKAVREKFLKDAGDLAKQALDILDKTR